jgi:OmcA/MtrC family decaheme c-type cytochrome
MRIQSIFVRAGFGVAILGAAAALIGANEKGFTRHEKAFYADANTVNFVRPGLVIKVTGASIAKDGTVTADLTLTDPKGVALDRLGVTTPGAVSVSFILAYIPKGQTQHVSYTVRAQKSPITGDTAMQAGADSGGVFKDLGNGAYSYTFGTRVPVSYDPTATHSVGAYGSRNLSEFDMGTNYADTVFNFVPDGSKVTVVRDVIRSASCNKCHDQMAFHGGSRRSIELCDLCHTPQTVDPDTGNTVDMAVFIHKLHAGASLPSVKAGKKYQIIGHSQTVADYSGINFPADVRNCTACHETTTGATQQARMNGATRTACGSCHDDVNFASGQNHVNLPQASDAQCTNCHQPKGSDLDASISGAHLIPRFSTALPGVVFELVKVDNAKPGANITVTFTALDKKGSPIKMSDLTRCNILLTGPNTDYALPGVTAGYVTETALTKAVGDGRGLFTYTMTAALPKDAKGSYTVAIEGRREVTLLPNTTRSLLVRDTGQNKQLAFSVDGSPVKKRRVIVANEKCNACHGSIAFHGDNRNDVAQCVVCHNAVYTTSDGQPLDFRTFIHRIHTGKEMTRSYVVGGVNYNEIGYPGDRRNCATCHVNNSQQLPLAEGTINVSDPKGYITSLPPMTAACTSCHDGKSAAAHAAVNTDAKQGESCDVCHGPNGDFSVDKAHAR